MHNECIKTKIIPHNEKLCGNKNLQKINGNSILLIVYIYETENKYYPQTFLDEFFGKHNDDNINSLFREIVQIFYWSGDESSN